MDGGHCFLVLLSLGISLHLFDFGGGEPAETCDEPEMLHLSFPSLEEFSPWGFGGIPSAGITTVVDTRVPASG